MQGSKFEEPFFIPFYYKINRIVAKITNPVKQYYGVIWFHLFFCIVDSGLAESFMVEKGRGVWVHNIENIFIDFKQFV